MSLVTGSLRIELPDATCLARLADVLADIHAISPTIHVRDYQSWAFEAKYTVAPGAVDVSLWDDAFPVFAPNRRPIRRA